MCSIGDGKGRGVGGMGGGRGDAMHLFRSAAVVVLDPLNEYLYGGGDVV